MTSQTQPNEKRLKDAYDYESFSNGLVFYKSGTLGIPTSKQDFIYQGLMPLTWSNGGSSKDTYHAEESAHDVALDRASQKVDTSATSRRRSPNSYNIVLDDGSYDHNIRPIKDSDQNNSSHSYDEISSNSKRFRRTQKLKSFQPKDNRTKRIPSFFGYAQKHVNMLLPFAILVWYLLGVLSISTTKLLLRDFGSCGVTPLFLTIQQLFIGLCFLRLWIYFGGNNPQSFDYISILGFQKRHDAESKAKMNLFYSASFFTYGFLLTNVSFGGANPSFIETIKASEPITSALIAVLWGIEHLSLKEATSLLAISIGVVISTFGNADLTSNVDDDNSTSVKQSFYVCGMVVAGNLCFSFRSLYQKLFRSSPCGNENILDDLNLQYRFHQIGIIVLFLPLALSEMFNSIRNWTERSTENILIGTKFWNFCGLSMINAFAFTHYNLASSFILSRISVIRHAALNCLRRLFAIIITSILFSVPITAFSRIGIAISVVGFVLFTKFKVEKTAKSRPQTSLLPMTNTKLVR